MALIEEALYATAVSNVQLAALIGTRWYGPVLEQFADKPAVTVQMISSESVMSHSGYSGLERVRMQITVWGACHLDVLQAVFRIERMLVGFRGVLAPGVAPVTVGRIFKAGRTDLGREPSQKLFKTALDLMIDYTVET